MYVYMYICVYIYNRETERQTDKLIYASVNITKLNLTAKQRQAPAKIFRLILLTFSATTT